MSNLRARLMAAMDPQQTFQSTVWGNPRPMSETLRDLRKSLGSGAEGPPPADLLQQALQGFAKTQQVANFTELKYVCYGVTVPLGQGRWRIIDHPPLFDRLLGLVEERNGQPKQFRRCYQGLLNGYFGFDRHSQPSPEGSTNWGRLRGYLGQKLDPILQTTVGRGVVPDWLSMLTQHQNLLTEDPCSRYARGLRNSSTEELKALCSALGIASTSWVWDEALMAYVQVVCDQPDVPFRHDMPAMLRLINGDTDLKLAQVLATRAAAMTVVRYAKSSDHPEHTDLVAFTAVVAWPRNARAAVAAFAACALDAAPSLPNTFSPRNFDTAPPTSGASMPAPGNASPPTTPATVPNAEPSTIRCGIDANWPGFTAPTCIASFAASIASSRGDDITTLGSGSDAFAIRTWSARFFSSRPGAASSAATRLPPSASVT